MSELPSHPWVFSKEQSSVYKQYLESLGDAVQGPGIMNALTNCSFGRILLSSDVFGISEEFERRASSSNIETARQSIAGLCYTPAKIPVYEILLRIIGKDDVDGEKRKRYIEIFRYLALVARVPVDSTDVLGYTTFQHAMGGRPTWEPEVAEILVEAGTFVNHRNRTGSTAAHDIVNILDESRGLQPGDKFYTNNSRRDCGLAIKYFVENGGDLGITDNNGVSAKKILAHMATVLGFTEFLPYASDEEVVDRCRACNARAQTSGGSLLTCGGCQVVRYCSRECQATDWMQHEGNCSFKVDGEIREYE